MDKLTPSSTLMVNISLDIEKDHFRPCENNEEINSEIPYMRAIVEIFYLEIVLDLILLLLLIYLQYI